MVRGGREDLRDDVVLLEVRADDAPAAATLASVGLHRQALHVAGARHGEDDVGLLDQVLDVQVASGLVPDLGPAWVGVPLPDLGQLILDHRQKLLGVLQQGLQPANGGQQLLVLVLQLLPGQPDQSLQGHVQDVVRLDLRELEARHQLGPCLLGVGGPSNDLDDLVDVLERDQQALDDVIALLRLAQLEPGPSGDDVHLMVQVVLEDLLQVERAREDAVDQGEHVDPEGLL